jgi:hypothetical protein
LADDVLKDEKFAGAEPVAWKQVSDRGAALPFGNVRGVLY